MNHIRIAIVGMGKIARDQHVPAILGNTDFTLSATVDPAEAGQGDVPHFNSLDQLLEHGPAVDAVALCTPPQIRYGLAARALDAGLHVLLEKPPGATLAEVAALVERADAKGTTLFAAWHSRFAAGVEPAREWLRTRTIKSVQIIWREDVRVWHPGQAWIWEAGGLGVFDPGINALSIATHILPSPFFLTQARLEMPANRAAPIAAALSFCGADGAKIKMDLDWRQTGPQSWDIIIETDAGTVALANGGAILRLPDATHQHEDCEYPALYDHFARLIEGGNSDVDIAPIRHVADAFLRGTWVPTDAFIEEGA